MPYHFAVESDYQYQQYVDRKLQTLWGKQDVPACGAEIKGSITTLELSRQLWKVDCRDCLEILRDSLPWEKAEDKESAYWHGWKQGMYDLMLDITWHNSQCHETGHPTPNFDRLPPFFACFAWHCFEKCFFYRRARTDGSQDRSWEEFIHARNLFKQHLGL